MVFFSHYYTEFIVENFTTFLTFSCAKRFEENCTYYIYMLGVSWQFDKDLAVMSQIFSAIFYMKVHVEKHISFFFKSFLISLSKIWKNSHKSYKLCQNFWDLLEDKSCKTAPLKKIKIIEKKRKTTGMHSLDKNKQKSSL